MKQVKNKVECYKDIHYNPNTKGAYYEKVVASVLNEYLGSRFDFHTRAQVIDAQLKYTEFLPYGSNEINVVGAFISATPKVVLKVDNRTFIPYDTIALVCEVKSKWLMEEPDEDGSSLIAIDRERFHRLVTALRTAVANENKLDKEQTSYNDIFDAFRLSLQYYKRSKS